jgi:hypothetical protein
MTMTRSQISADLEIFEVKPGLKFALTTLKALLPDVETLLFFGKVYELDVYQLSALLAKMFAGHNLVDELQSGAHSTDLQDYIVDDLCPELWNLEAGEVEFAPDVAKGEILPEVWKSLEVEVAASIKAVAAKLQDMVGLMPGKQGSMVFRSMMTMNAKRPTIGQYKAAVHHAPKPDNLIIFDVSGSMGERLVQTLVDDVVAMSYMANAHLAIVSNTTTHWEPGSYDSASVLAAAEFGGTQYETLAPLLERDWGVVVTVADYDSSASARDFIARNCRGSIEQVLDISLVNRPTFLAECVGQLANEVRPVLVATGSYVLSN